MVGQSTAGQYVRLQYAGRGGMSGSKMQTGIGQDLWIRQYCSAGNCRKAAVLCAQQVMIKYF